MLLTIFATFKKKTSTEFCGTAYPALLSINSQGILGFSKSKWNFNFVQTLILIQTVTVSENCSI